MRKVTILCLAVILTMSIAALGEKKARGRGGNDEEKPGLLFVSKETPSEARRHAVQRVLSEQEESRYKGISVKPHPDARDGDLAVQQQIIGVLEGLDYIPPHRVNAFRHLTENMGEVINGWNAEVLSCDAGNGGFILTLRVWPRLANSGLGFQEHTIETYFYADGAVEHIHLEAPEVRHIYTIN